MTVHPRKDWTSTKAADAHPFADQYVKGTAVHWNGPTVPKSALSDPRSFLEGVRRFHVNTRKWSDIAYNMAVDQQGGIWVLRGMAHMSGANGDTTTNTKYVACLAIIGEGQAPSKKMLASLGTVVGMVRAEYPRATQVVTHQAIRPGSTACPGPDLIKAVNSRALEPGPGLPEVSVHFMRHAWEKDRNRKTGLHPIQTRRVQKALGLLVQTGRWGKRTRGFFPGHGPTAATLKAVSRGAYKVVD